jgi:hypothetical protein
VYAHTPTARIDHSFVDSVLTGMNIVFRFLGLYKALHDHDA